MSPSVPRTAEADAAPRGGTRLDAARAARVRRSGWLFGLLAVSFYFGFIVWNLIRAPLG